MAGPVCVDTSALVALIVNEPHSAAVAAWYAGSGDEWVCAAWCVPEFASVLSIKQRTGPPSAEQVGQAWERFERLTAADGVLMPVSEAAYRRAVALVMDPASGLRAGDALHLACAVDARAHAPATLDTVQTQAARRLRIEPMEFGASP